jgi:hypothetical protein
MITAVCLKAQAAFELNGNNRQTFPWRRNSFFAANIQKDEFTGSEIQEQRNLPFDWDAPFSLFDNREKVVYPGIDR